jgi:cephalosporin-C deacetylase-like acetyl esterase
LPLWLNSGFDHADFIYAFGPKPYLMLSAIRDFFSITGARETFAEAKRIYEVMGIQEKLQMVEADDGHGYSKPRRLAAYRWFGRWLKGTEDQEPEPEVQVEPETKLWCTETGQVITSLGGETVFSLNRKRVEQLRRKRPDWTAPSELNAYRTAIRTEVARAVGLARPLRPNEKLVISSFGTISRRGYRIEKLVYESEPGIKIPALLFVPDQSDSPKPATIYVHGRGKAAEAGAGGEIEQLVQAGLIVLSIDVRGMGETRVAADEDRDFYRYFGDYDSAMTGLLVGRPLVGMRALDISRGVDLLTSRSDVDSRRICAVGKEKGTVPMLYAAVLDERIQRIALEGMVLSYQAITDRRIHRQVFEDVIVGALTKFDLPDLVASLSPRPVWVVSIVDPLGHRIEAETALAEYIQTRKAFQLAGAEERFHMTERRPGASFLSTYQGWLK